MSTRRKAPVRGSLRVIAGTLRGRRFDAPPGATTRPTANRVRQATFNALESMGAIEGAVVLDAYAGSGALGIEALSRGAVHATFAERDGAARRTVEANVEALGLTDVARVVPGDGGRAASVGGPWDLVLLDPPYGFDAWDELLALVVDVLADDGVVVIESDRPVDLPDGVDALRVKQYGVTVVTIASPRRSPS